jgi:predicted ester cyclase
MSQHPTTLTDAMATCAHSLQIMADGDLADFEALIHPEAINREASGPPATRGTGPAAFHAAALWLRGAFSGLRWEVHDMAADSDLVAIHSTWSGRHVRPFVTYDDAGTVAQAMPPTGKTFAATQSHWFRPADGKIIEHWANRDDLAMAQQLGWIPPSPGYLVRMALAKNRARRRGNRVSR